MQKLLSIGHTYHTYQIRIPSLFPPRFFSHVMAAMVSEHPAGTFTWMSWRLELSKKMELPHKIAGWFLLWKICENPTKMDDLGVPLF